MKALTLHQPWATLVAFGAKQIETRSWTTKHRGPLAIHAASSIPRASLLLALVEPYRSTLAAAGYTTPYQLPAGEILAIATLAAIYPIVDANKVLIDNAVYIIHEPELTYGDYTPGRYAWMLPYVGRLKSLPNYRGFQRLWNWNPLKCPVCDAFITNHELALCPPCWNENATMLGLIPNTQSLISKPSTPNALLRNQKEQST